MMTSAKSLLEVHPFVVYLSSFAGIQNIATFLLPFLISGLDRQRLNNWNLSFYKSTGDNSVTAFYISLLIGLFIFYHFLKRIGSSVGRFLTFT